MGFSGNGPLVSIGIPTYNRPDLLVQALNRAINQTYSNLEIIISDNSSTDPRVAEIIRDFSLKDHRIRPFFQTENIGAFNNFFFVLRQSSADFFMWSADDDYMEPWLVEKSINILCSEENIGLVCSEAQYIDEDGEKFPFVAEGSPFRATSNLSPIDRLKFLIENNYGNLVYGLFKKKALIRNSDIFWETTTLKSTNEIPILLFAAFIGDIVVYPEIGLYKRVPKPVYDQVVWENLGGWMPSHGRIRSIVSLFRTIEFHKKSLQDITSAINLLLLNDNDKIKLMKISRQKIWKHFFDMLVGYKSRKKI